MLSWRLNQEWRRIGADTVSSSYGCTKDRIKDLKKEEKNEDIWFKLKHDTL